MEAINENESVALNEILLNILEKNFNLFFGPIVKFDIENEKNRRYFNKYFHRYINTIIETGKKNSTFLMFDTTLNIFENCLNNLEFIYINSLEEEPNKQKINNELLKFIKIFL